MFKKCYKHNDTALTEKYKKFANKLTTIKRVAKQNYYAAMIELNKKNLSKQGQLINQILQRSHRVKKPLTKLITEKNETSTDNEDISNELNNFFSTIGSNMASKKPSVAAIVDMLKTIPFSMGSFFCNPCSVHEVYHEIMCLNEKKAAGIENIPIKFIKISSECISAVLSNIFNKCIQEYFHQS